MGNLSVKPHIPNAGADRFYDAFAHSFASFKDQVNDYKDTLQVISTQLQYVPPQDLTFHLAVNGRPIGAALFAIANALVGDQHVRQLSLESTAIDAERIPTLTGVLGVNRTIEELYLSGNNLGVAGVTSLVTALNQNTTLRTLHIASSGVGDEGAKAVAHMLATRNTTLQRLDLSNNDIGPEGLRALSDAVQKNEGVVELTLRDNPRCPQDELDALQKVLRARFEPFRAALKERELQAQAERLARGGEQSSNASSSGRAGGKGSLFRRRSRQDNVAAASSTSNTNYNGGGGSASNNNSPDHQHKVLSSRAAGGVGEAVVSKNLLGASGPGGAKMPDGVANADEKRDSQLDWLDFLRSEPPPSVVAGKKNASHSEPSSPRKTRIKKLVRSARKNERHSEGNQLAGSSSEEDGAEPGVLHLHVVEGAGFSASAKGGIMCHIKGFNDVNGKQIRTKAVKKTATPFWDQWYAFSVGDLTKWAVQLIVREGSGEKRVLGTPILRSKDWNLCDAAGAERWVACNDRPDAPKVLVGLKAKDETLDRLLALRHKAREPAKAGDATGGSGSNDNSNVTSDAEAATDTKGRAGGEGGAVVVGGRSRGAPGRPRGRTMLAAPKPNLKKTTEPPPEIPESKSLRFFCGHADTIGRRPTMEDAMLIQGNLGGQTNRDLFAVFDGHGSAKVAIHCAQRLGSVLLQKLEEEKDPLQALRSAFLALDAEVDGFAINMGCTAVAALIIEDTIYVANCGDTRAVLCTEGGVAERLTLDHKPSLPDEIKRIEGLGGAVVNGRVQGQLAVSRAIGDANFAPFISAEPYLRKCKLSDSDTHLILACDGLWDVFPDSLACQITSNKKHPAAAAKMLRDRAFASGSTDNISILCIQFAAPPAEQEEQEELKKSPDIAQQAAGADVDPFADFGHYDDGGKNKKSNESETGGGDGEEKKGTEKASAEAKEEDGIGALVKQSSRGVIAGAPPLDVSGAEKTLGKETIKERKANDSRSLRNLLENDDDSGNKQRADTSGDEEEEEGDEEEEKEK